MFQGTVWGPPLWSVFYADARHAIQAAGFEEVVYADDLNAYRAVPNHVPLDAALTQAAECQSSLHRWGQANQVVFDPAKRSFHILSRTQGYADNFSLLGVGSTCSFSCTALFTSALLRLAGGCGRFFESRSSPARAKPS